MNPTVTRPLKVITRSDIPAGYRAITIDNSIYARFNEGTLNLNKHPKSEDLRRFLNVMGSLDLQKGLQIQFVISQALHYDRIRDVPSERRSEDENTEAVVRSLSWNFVAVKAPDHVNVLMEWPVARVDSLLAQLPNPVETRIESQDDQQVELRLTPIPAQTHRTSELKEGFRAPEITIQVPLCVYEPGTPEDSVARVFGFNDFSSLIRLKENGSLEGRIADVCHASSHLRFSRPGDLFIALDPHFLNRRAQLLAEGIVCFDPRQFMDQIDPEGLIKPVEVG